MSHVLTRYVWNSSVINTLKLLDNFPAHHSAWCVIGGIFYSKCWLSCGNRHRTRNIIYTWRACHGSSNWKTAHVPHYSYMSCCACTFWNSPCVMLPPSVICQIGGFPKRERESFYTSPPFVAVLTHWTVQAYRRLLPLCERAGFVTRWGVVSITSNFGAAGFDFSNQGFINLGFSWFCLGLPRKF